MGTEAARHAAHVVADVDWLIAVTDAVRRAGGSWDPADAATRADAERLAEWRVSQDPRWGRRP